MSHEMVRLAEVIGWEDFEKTSGAMWEDKGRPAIAWTWSDFAAVTPFQIPSTGRPFRPSDLPEVA